MGPLRTYSEDINGITYSFATTEELRPFAEPLLEAIEYIPTERIKDGFRIRAGFSTFLLSEHNGGFDIAAPDFTDDPLTALTTDLTLALHVQYRQVRLLHIYGIVGKPVHFYDRIAVAKGALDNKYISMQRFRDLDGSGWAIESYTMTDDGEAEPVRAESYDLIYAYELITKRPELVDVLLLPDDYLAVFEGEELIEIFDEKEKSLMH